MSALTNLAPAVPVADNLLAARELMAFTLGFHIILACVGVALPAMMLIAEFKGRRNDDEVALDLAKRWSKAAAVLFAVGAVTGTVLSFEMGLLWPRFMERFGDVFGTGFAIEGIFFFTEAIFIAIYIYGWKRIDGWKHWWTGVPIVIAGIGGAFSVVAVNSWMNQPQGFTLDSAGNPTDVEPLNGALQPGDVYEFPHMLLAAYMVVGFGLASIYAIGMLRKPERAKRSPPPARAADPADGRGDPHPGADLRRRRRGARGRRPPALEVRRLRVHLRDRARPDRVARRDLHRRRASSAGSGSPGSTRCSSASAPTPSSPASTRSPTTRSRPRTRCSTSPSTRWSGSASPCSPLGGWLALCLVAQARLPGDEVVPARGRAQRHRRGRRDGGGLDRDRGRTTAVDRLRG